MNKKRPVILCLATCMIVTVLNLAVYAETITFAVDGHVGFVIEDNGGALKIRSSEGGQGTAIRTTFKKHV